LTAKGHEWSTPIAGQDTTNGKMFGNLDDEPRLVRRAFLDERTGKLQFECVQPEAASASE